jgi:hypothetical protein
MIFTDTYIEAWVVACTALTHDDVTGDSRLTTKNLDT